MDNEGAINVREGKADWTFDVTGKEPLPPVGKGKALHIDGGHVTARLAGGEWELTTVVLRGRWLTSDGKPSQTQGEAILSAPLNDLHNPAPGWLIAESEEWVRALNSARSPETREAYIRAYTTLDRDLPPLGPADVDPTARRILRDLITDPDALDLVFRMFKPEQPVRTHEEQEAYAKALAAVSKMRPLPGATRKQSTVDLMAALIPDELTRAAVWKLVQR